MSILHENILLQHKNLAIHDCIVLQRHHLKMNPAHFKIFTVNYLNSEKQILLIMQAADQFHTYFRMIGEV